MALNLDFNPLSKVIDSVMGGSVGDWVLQIAVIVAGVFLGWLLGRQLCGRVRISPQWQFGKGDFERVAFPLFALGVVSIGRWMLGRYNHDVALLDVVEPLLVAFAFTRMASYILGHVIREGGLQHTVINLVRWAAWIVAVLHISGLLPEILISLESVGFTFGKIKTEITVLDLVKGVIALFLTVILALWLSRVTENRVMASESMEVTTRVVLTKIVRIATLFVVVFVALPMMGLDVTTLSIFSGALGVGLGFGLQKIASNYISGFIVLVDRSLRIGDVVTVDGRRGEVTAIESRYTVIKGADGVESILPNEKLITETVSHHTYSDPKVSVVLATFVSYESDVQKACDLLIEFAHGHKRVIPDPPPTARVKQLGDNGVELELTVWIKDPAVGEADLKSALFKDILRGFKAAGIEIPYPHREIRMIATGATDKALDPSST
jgi:small-conductance mechanosensitive channel